MLTTSESTDIAANELKHLFAATKKAVDEQTTAVIPTFCPSLDPQAGSCVGDFFRHYGSVLGRIDRPSKQLPKAVMNLSRHTRV